MSPVAEAQGGTGLCGLGSDSGHQPLSRTHVPGWSSGQQAPTTPRACSLPRALGCPAVSTEPQACSRQPLHPKIRRAGSVQGLAVTSAPPPLFRPGFLVLLKSVQLYTCKAVRSGCSTDCPENPQTSHSFLHPKAHVLPACFGKSRRQFIHN